MNDSPQFELAFPAVEGDAGDSPRIRVSARARRLSLRVYPDARVEVVVPPRARPRDIEHFIAAHRQWIDEKRSVALCQRPAPQPFPPAHIEIRTPPESWRVHLAGGAGRLCVAEAVQDGAICLASGTSRILRISGAMSNPKLRTALRHWLMRVASASLEPRVAALAARTGVRYSRVSIRRQRSRWGSCSARGTISLNCCLVFQRPEVVDYLIVHELMHVKHMNHSARFWQAVASHCADWRALDRELVQGWRHVPRWVFSEE